MKNRCELMNKYKNILGAFLVLFLSACAPMLSPNNMSAVDSSVQRANADERLGTKWGDEISSSVSTVSMRRLSPSPIEQTRILYADKNYLGRKINAMSLVAGKISFSIESDNERLPLYRDAGRYYLRGKAGQPYRLVYHNNSQRDIYEIVASVDGTDVLNGKKASRYNMGYMLRPKKTLVIEGFRKSDSAVASFIFSKPSDAYVANKATTELAKNTGIIGTAIYQLEAPRQHNKPVKIDDDLHAFPADHNHSTGYAEPPQ